MVGKTALLSRYTENRFEEKYKGKHSCINARASSLHDQTLHDRYLMSTHVCRQQLLGRIFGAKK